MHVFIVYTHPAEDSFTRHLRDAFIKGLLDGNHTYEISDLYKMNFQSDITEQEYLRESNYMEDVPLPDDVITEQEKINRCDIIVFIYPVFWTEAPSKLVGWFDRVWTYGFAYGNRTMKKLKKALVLCVAGHTLENLVEYGHIKAMKTVMIKDRVFDRAESSEMYVFDGMAKNNMELRSQKWDGHLKVAFNFGKGL